MLLSLDSGMPVYTELPEAHDPGRALCFTGHREKSITPYKNDQRFKELTCTAVRLMLCRFIDLAAQQDYSCFISGLATGTDLWAADHVVRKKRLGEPISLIGALPYLRHSELFPPKYKEILISAEKHADILVAVNSSPDISYGRSAPNTSTALYRDRNHFMVDNSSAVIAFFNIGNRYSGTFQTLSYAIRKQRTIYLFGLGDVYRIIDEAGTDIRKIQRRIGKIDTLPLFDGQLRAPTPTI